MKINAFSTNVGEWFIRQRGISGKILMDLIGSAGLTHRIINNSTFTPPPAAFYTAHLSCLHKEMKTITRDFNHLKKANLFGTVNICICCRIPVSRLAPLPPQPQPPSLHVSPCLSKTAAWQITCVGGPPCSCLAVRPPLINAQAGARAVWQHKTNNATTQPSLLLTEMQPTALFRPLWLHSAPCTRPSGPPPPPPRPSPAPACAAPPNFLGFLGFFFAVA